MDAPGVYQSNWRKKKKDWKVDQVGFARYSCWHTRVDTTHTLKRREYRKVKVEGDRCGSFRSWGVYKGRSGVAQAVDANAAAALPWLLSCSAWGPRWEKTTIIARTRCGLPAPFVLDNGYSPTARGYHCKENCHFPNGISDLLSRLFSIYALVR